MMETDGQKLIERGLCWGHICDGVLVQKHGNMSVHEKMLYVTTKGLPSFALVVLSR